MKEPFSIFKIQAPKISRVLYRDRLLEILKNNHDKKLILILGQAAQGKTTLAASFSEKCERPSAWINLSAEESDPVNLFRLIIYSIQHACGENAFSDLFQYIALDLGPRSEIPLYRSWARACFEKISSPIQIILDGIEQLLPEAQSLKTIKCFLEEASDKVRFIVLSRVEPPLEVSKLKMRQQALVIDNEQLAFTKDETEKYCGEIHRLTLSLEQITKIHDITEGWIGGLLLIIQAIKKEPEKVGQSLYSDDLLCAFRKETYRYIANEIFATLHEDVKSFLVKSSFLEVIDPPVITNLLDGFDAFTILKELSEKNLFIQMIYDHNGRCLFRYHQMFKDFLRSRFHVDIKTKERQSLYAKAGSIFEEFGDFQNALANYLSAKSYDRASNVLENIGIELLTTGRVKDLSHWIQSFPDDLVRQNPWLLYFLSATRRYAAARENANSLLNCLEMFEKRGDIRGQILSLAYLLEAFSLGGYHPIPAMNVISRAEILLQKVAVDEFKREIAVLWLQLGQSVTVIGGNPRKGFWCCKKAYMIAESFGGVQLQFSAMNFSVEALAWLGEFEMADEICSSLNEFFQQNIYAEMRAYQFMALANLDMLRGRIQNARNHILESYKLIEQHGLLYLYAPALAADLFITVYSGELDKAENIAQQMMDLAKSFGNLVFEAIALFDMAWISYRKGDWLAAKHLIEKPVTILKSDESLTLYHYHAAIVLKSRILNYLESGNVVEIELQSTIDYLSNIPDYLTLIDAHFCMAHIRYKKKEYTNSAFHLSEGFKLAESKSHYHLALLNREDFTDTCILAVKLLPENQSKYPIYLLSNHLSDLAEQRLKIFEHEFDSNFRSNALQLRKNIRLQNLPRLHIKCFSELKIWRGDKLIGENEWKRLYPKILLKALISRGAWQVPRDLLMEDLWPESKAEAAEKNFKVTLHRLRKVLEPDMNKDYGSMYLHLHNNHLSLDRNLCTIDIDQYVELINTGNEEENAGNIKLAIKSYKKAIDKYTASFFENDIYLSFTEIKRDELRKILIDSLFRLADAYEKQQKIKSAIKCYQRAAHEEPTFEGAYQKLIGLYARVGMKTAAIKIYNDYEKLIREQLCCEPDHVTKAIIKKIIEDK